MHKYGTGSWTQTAKLILQDQDLGFAGRIKVHESPLGAPPSESETVPPAPAEGGLTRVGCAGWP